VFSNGLVGLAFPVPLGLSKADFARFLKFDQSAWPNLAGSTLGHPCLRRCMALELHRASQALAGAMDIIVGHNHDVVSRAWRPASPPL